MGHRRIEAKFWWMELKIGVILSCFQGDEGLLIFHLQLPIYTKENLLVLHEYRHAFKDSFLLVDSSYTSGYKKTNKLKKSDGSRSPFFAKFNRDLSKDDFSSNLEINYNQIFH